jgi:hypothetical protein
MSGNIYPYEADGIANYRHQTFSLLFLKMQEISKALDQNSGAPHANKETNETNISAALLKMLNHSICFQAVYRLFVASNSADIQEKPKGDSNADKLPSIGEEPKRPWIPIIGNTDTSEPQSPLTLG